MQEDITLTAKWNLESYNITYVLNGGTNNSNNPITYTIESGTLSLYTPTNDVYTFGGWYTSPDFSNDVVSTISSETIGNIILYAKWLEKGISVSELASLDLSTLTEPYTLVIDGYVSETALKTIAAKIKTATEEITLDLSRTSFTVIPINCFSGCTKLTSITLPSTLKIIGNGAFASTSLISIEIGHNVKSIGAGAFRQCSQLLSVEFLDTSNWYYDKEKSEIGRNGGTYYEKTAINVSNASINLRNLNDVSETYSYPYYIYGAGYSVWYKE